MKQTLTYKIQTSCQHPKLTWSPMGVGGTDHYGLEGCRNVAGTRLPTGPLAFVGLPVSALGVAPNALLSPVLPLRAGGRHEAQAEEMQQQRRAGGGDHLGGAGRLAQRSKSDATATSGPGTGRVSFVHHRRRRESGHR